MTDDWDNDDFVPQTLNTRNEEANYVPLAVSAAVPVANSQLSNEEAAVASKRIEDNRKKAKEEEKRVLDRMTGVRLENETPEQRRLRERIRDEDADKSITEDLFGAKSSGNSQSNDQLTEICGLALSTKQDHTNFGVFISQRLVDSTPLHLASFMDIMTKTLAPNLSVESLDEILATLNRIRASKIAQRQTSSAAEKKTRETKIKKKKTEEKRIEAVFGESNDDSYRNDDYNKMEDDFM